MWRQDVMWGGCLPPPWCDWDHTSWCEVLVWGEKGKIDLYFTPLCPATLCADWSTIIHGIWTLCCTLPPSHLSWMSPKAIKSEPVGSKTCSSCLHWQALARLMEKVCLRKAEKTLWAARTCCVTPDPGQATWGPHFPLQLTFSGVSRWLQVLSLADYCSFHFLLVSFGFGYLLIFVPLLLLGSLG